MKIRRARQILKALSDDTRLRIVNLLSRKDLHVADLCKILHKKQSNVSKHLARLRLLGVVSDRRKGLNVYYYLPETNDKIHKELRKVVTVGLAELVIFQRDLQELKRLK